MKYESLAADLRSWLQDSIGRGCSREVMVQSLRAAGYQPKFASRAVELAFAKLAPDDNDVAVETAPDEADDAGTAATAAQGASAAASTGAAAAAAAQAETADGKPPSSTEILAESPNGIETSDRVVRILMALNAPRIVLFGDLLSAEECDEIIRMARPKVARSTVVNSETGSYDVHDARTSQGTYFQRGENELIRRIETRISELISMPVENGEPIQILHYLPGAEYKPHFDYFDPKYPGNERVLAMGGQRIATLIMYLNDVDAGGSTVFPEVGLDVLPRKGNAVFFAYSSESGELDSRTLHGGSPVSAGEKWIATKWLRLREYKQA
ncbi:MAG TPA: 2OG-Fe(II) oxygenase [Burkholderiaceae bacterium]|nr:2OG-Fe(II) oxygenase [Burkholderiaceae bacterium]